MRERIKNIALLGAYAHADKFGRLINSFPESHVYAVWDEDPEQARRVAEEIGCQAAENVEEILAEPELDAVVISCMNDLHRTLAVKAAEMKKDIFLEKPLAGDLGDGYAIRDAVKKNGVRFFMSDPFVNASTAYIRSFIRAGKLGKLLSIRIRFSNGTSAFSTDDEDARRSRALRMGGGVMSDTGGHPLHILNYLVGNPLKVQAVFTYHDDTDAAIGNESAAVMLMQYPDNVSAVLEAGTDSFGFTNCVEVWGTRGCIRETGLGDRSRCVSYKTADFSGADLRFPDVRKRLEELDWTVVPEAELGEEPEQHIRYFVHMLTEGIPNEAAGEERRGLHGMNIDQAVEVLELIDAVKRAAKNDVTVSLPKVRRIDFSLKHDVLIKNPDRTLQPMDEPWYHAEKVAEGVWQIQSDGDYSYLVEGAREALLIDSGYGAGNIREFARTLVKVPVNAIACTHNHFDHTANNGYFDLAYMSEYTAANATIPFPSFSGIDFPRNYPVKIVREGDRIDLGNRELEVIMIPDHTPGGTAFLDRKNKILFSGDEIFEGTQRVNTTVAQYYRNMKKLADNIDDIDIICGGFSIQKSEILLKLTKGLEDILSGAEGEPMEARMPLGPDSGSGDQVIYHRFMPRPEDMHRPDPESMKSKRIYSKNGLRIQYDINKIHD